MTNTLLEHGYFLCLQSQCFLATIERKYCDHNCYTSDRFWWEEDAADIAKKISWFKKVNHLLKWLRIYSH
jgi:hypothetical protein